MSFLIGVITARNSLENIEAALAKIPSAQAEFIYLPYEDMPGSVLLYQQNAASVDGFLFSGFFPYHYITHRIGILQKPGVCIAVTHRDYYRTFLQILYQNRGLDIRRVCMEKPELEIPWAALFGDANHVPVFCPEPESREEIFSDEFIAGLQEFYTEAYRSRKADYIITRMTNMTRELQKNNIPCMGLYPSPDSIREAAEKLLNSLKTMQANDRLPVACLVAAQEHRQETAELLDRFNLENGGAMVVREQPGRFEIISTNLFLRQITRKYTQSLLGSYLEAQLEESCRIGCGIGVNVVQAEQNAVTALNEAMRSKEGGTFIVTETGILRGPLGRCDNETLSIKPDQHAVRLARLIGTSATTAQKLLHFVQQQEVVIVSRNDLVSFLNITPRTANRLLNNMVKAGCARLVNTGQTASAGRPIHHYELVLQETVKANGST